MLLRAATYGGLLLLTTAAVCSVAFMPAFAASTDECIVMGDNLLAAKKSNNQGRVLDVSRRVVSECDSVGMASLAQHFHQIGQDGLALGVADACVKTYPQAVLCWVTKGAQHVHQREAKEAEDAYTQALAREKDPDEQQKIKHLMESVHRAKRWDEIFGH